MSGAGTLTLSEANTFTGATTLTTGTVIIGSNQAFGTSTVNLNGGSVQADASARTLANKITLKLSSTGTLTLGGSSANTFVGTTTVNGGTLLLAKSSGNAITGSLIIGEAGA